MSGRMVERWEVITVTNDLFELSKNMPKVLAVIAGKSAKGAKVLLICSSEEEVVRMLSAIAADLQPQEHLCVIHRIGSCFRCIQQRDDSEPCGHFDRIATRNQSYNVDLEKIKRA